MEAAGGKDDRRCNRATTARPARRRRVPLDDARSLPAWLCRIDQGGERALFEPVVAGLDREAFSEAGLDGAGRARVEVGLQLVEASRGASNSERT
jgi:hypothetical protein